MQDTERPERRKRNERYETEAEIPPVPDDPAGGGHDAARRDPADDDLFPRDDLGTELTNSFTVSALYSVLNERELRKHSTIISLHNFSILS